MKAKETYTKASNYKNVVGDVKYCHVLQSSAIFRVVMDFLHYQVAMRALGFDVKKADVLKILRDYDREGTGKISFEDFNEVSK